MKKESLQEAHYPGHHSRISSSSNDLPGGLGDGRRPAPDLRSLPHSGGRHRQGPYEVLDQAGANEPPHSNFYSSPGSVSRWLRSAVPAVFRRRRGGIGSGGTGTSSKALQRTNYHRHLARGPGLLAFGPRPLLPLLLLFFASVTLSACGATQPGTPTEAALAVYEAANEGDLDLLEVYYSEDLAQGMEGPIGDAIGGTPGMADHLARGGAIEEIRVEDVDASGDLARVTIFLRYNEAAMEQRNAGDAFGEDNPVTQTLPLVQEDGTWKVSADYLRGV